MSNSGNSARQAITFGGLLNAVSLLKPLLAGGKLSPLDLFSMAFSLLGSLKSGAAAAQQLIVAPPIAEALTAATITQLLNDVVAALADGRITLLEAGTIVRDIISLAVEYLGENNAPASAASGSSATPPAAGIGFGFPSNG